MAVISQKLSEPEMAALTDGEACSVEIAAAATAESMAEQYDTKQPDMIDEPMDTSESAVVPSCVSRDFEADKENIIVERSSSAPRSSADNALQAQNQSEQDSPDEDRRSKMADSSLTADGAADGAAGTAAGLTADAVNQRAAELFPPGATMPAVKPSLPPVLEAPTNELARLSFGAANTVSLVRGVLAREEAAAHILADHVGVELLREEALPLGEQVRKAAVAAKKKEEALKKAAASKRSDLRKKAEKSAELAAALDESLHMVDLKLAADRADFLAKEIELSKLPDRNSVVVERRAPAPEPAALLAPPPAVSLAAPAPEAQGTCENCTGTCRCVELPARAISNVEMAQSQEAAAAIDAAFAIMDQGRRRKDPYFNKQLELAQVEFKHALRDLRRAYPGEFCGIGETDHDAIVGWTVRLAAFGISIPAAEVAARRVRFNMAGAVAEVAPQIEAARAAQEGRVCA